MNQVHQINCKYLAPNRKVEELLVYNNYDKTVIYIYDFKETSFRVFSSKTN